VSKAVTTRIGVTDKATPKLRRASREVTKYGRAWQRTARITQRATRLMGRGFSRVGRGMRTLMRRAKFMVIGLQLTATIMGVQMVRAALKYERSLRNVTSLMAGVGMSQQKIEKNFRNMDKAIRAMAVRTGQMPNDLAAGMYNVVSATFDGASGLKVLEAAAVGAFAGLSDTNTVTGLLTKTLQAYREEQDTNMTVANRATGVMDDYFMAVNRGMFTFDDLATKMGALPSTADAFGVSLKDLLSFLSTATVRGVGLDEAITGIRQGMIQIGKLTPQTEKAAESLFGADYKDVWGPQALAANGLYGTLERMNKFLPKIDASMLDMAISVEEDGGDAWGALATATGDSVEAIAQLFPNIRALKAILAVTGPGMKLYGDNMGFLADSAGAAGRAQDEMAKSAAGSLQFLKAAWETFKIDVGNIALPFIKNIADSMVEWWGDIPIKFSAETGGGAEKDLQDRFGFDDGTEIFTATAGDRWADAAPGDKIGFILRTGWSEGLDNLKTWFDTEGAGKVRGIGESIGRTLANALLAITGTGEGSGLGWDIANALVTGIRNGFKQLLPDGIMGLLWKKDGGEDGSEGGGGMTGAGASVAAVVTAMGLKRAVPWLFGLFGTTAAAGTTAAVAGTTAATTGSTFATMIPIGATAGGVAGGAAATTGSGFLSAIPGLGVLLSGVLGSLYVNSMQGSDNPNVASAGRAGVSAIANNGQGSLGGDAQMWGDFLGLNTPADGRRAMDSNTMGGRWIAAGQRDYKAVEMGAIKDQYATNAITQSIVDGIEPMAPIARDFDMGTRRFASAVSRMPTAGLGGGGGGTAPPDGGIVRNAIGGSYTVSKPTMFLGGEAGTEDVSFTPHRGRSKGGAGAGTTVYATISVTEASNAQATAAQVVRELEKAVLNG